MIEFPRRRDPEYLTADELATRWRCSRAKVYRIHPSLLPYHKIGGAKLYLRVEVEGYEQEMRVAV